MYRTLSFVFYTHKLYIYFFSGHTGSRKSHSANSISSRGVASGIKKLREKILLKSAQHVIQEKPSIEDFDCEIAVFKVHCYIIFMFQLDVFLNVLKIKEHFKFSAADCFLFLKGFHKYNFIDFHVKTFSGRFNLRPFNLYRPCAQYYLM